MRIGLDRQGEVTKELIRGWGMSSQEQYIKAIAEEQMKLGSDYKTLAAYQRDADLMRQIGEPFHYLCGKPYTVNITIEGVAPLLYQGWHVTNREGGVI